jgi:hypothetical protein
MQGSYRTARIVETRNLFLGWRRHRVRAVEPEDCDLLVGLLANVHSAVNALGWLLRVNPSRRNLDAMALSPSRYSIKSTSPPSTTATR